MGTTIAEMLDPAVALDRDHVLGSQDAELTLADYAAEHAGKIEPLLALLEKEMRTYGGKTGPR